jgi:hypothetical protein
MDSKYYNKYIKYKNKYILLKNNNKSLQIGGSNLPNYSNMPNFRFDTMAGQFKAIMDTLRNTFIIENSRIFRSTQYFSEYTYFELSIAIINKLKTEAYYDYRNDPSYSAKISMMDSAINQIQIFLNCIKTKIPHDRTILQIIYDKFNVQFNHITEIPVRMFEHILSYLNDSGIDTFTTVCDNLYQIQYNVPTVPPNSNYPNGPYGQNSIAGTTNPYGPNGLSNPNSPNYQLSPNYPITTYVPKSNFSNDDDSSDDSSDEPIIKTSKYNSSNSVTIINIQTTKDKKITFTKNGDFVLKEGKSKDVEFELLIYVNNKKSYSIQSNVKKNKIINLFYNNTDKAKPEQIKNISIENGNNKIKINYNTKSLKELLKKLQKVIN